MSVIGMPQAKKPICSIKIELFADNSITADISEKVSLIVILGLVEQFKSNIINSNNQIIKS